MKVWNRRRNNIRRSLACGRGGALSDPLSGGLNSALAGALAALLFATAFLATPAHAQKDGVQASAVITVMPKRGKESRPVTRDAVNVGSKAQVEAWTPLTGDRAGLQLVVLLDDSSSARIDNQIADVRTFVLALPATTEVAIGYMQDGHAGMMQGFTTDHAAAAKTLRSTMGNPGGNASPYFALQDLIKRWPSGTGTRPARREVLMVTDGVDRYSSGDRYSSAHFDADNQYVLAAIHDAQQAGIVVHSIYFRGAGTLDSNQNVVLGGQSYLEQLTKATGGKCYLEGLGNPVSFEPILNEFSERLQNQYELSFMSGDRVEHDLVPLKLKIQAPNVTVDAPDMVRILVPGAAAGTK